VECTLKASSTAIGMDERLVKACMSVALFDAGRAGSTLSSSTTSAFRVITKFQQYDSSIGSRDAGRVACACVSGIAVDNRHDICRYFSTVGQNCR
jgi:hypothetical protein